MPNITFFLKPKVKLISGMIYTIYHDLESGNKYKDLSTCGGLHSIGSDITRTRGRSDANMNDSTRTENGLVRKLGRSGNTPTSRAEV